MTINELTITSDHLTVHDLFINKVNNVLVTDYQSLYFFISSFYDIQNARVFLGNNKIDTKTSYIINLLDYESIYNQLTLKKGTILYEYLFDEINESIEKTDIKEEIEIKLKSLTDIALKDRSLVYDIDYDIDMAKIITSFINIDIDLGIANYISIIKKLISNLKQKNMKRSIIIFLNSKLFNDQLDDIEGIYIFKFYSDDIPNILINKEIENIDQSLLMNNIILNWPCDISIEEASSYIKQFFTDIKISNTLITNDYKKCVLYNILSKLISIEFSFKLTDVNLDNIPSSYKNYLKSLN